jgi:hypothetical protein
LKKIIGIIATIAALVLVVLVIYWTFFTSQMPSAGLFALMLIFFANITGKLAGVDAITTIRIIGIGLLFPAFFGCWISNQNNWLPV